MSIKNKNNKYPKVTVVMSVYNEENSIADAINSILNQTFKNFEFLIIDDGSTDMSLKIINDFKKKDLRIRVLKNKKNLNLSNSLNKGIKLSRGKYIARMDADDISLPDRLYHQVKFLDSNPDIGICGTWIMNKKNGNKKIKKYPINHELIKINLLFKPPIAHPTAILKKETIIENNLFYNPKFNKAQDYELWSRAIQKTKFTNIPKVLCLKNNSNKDVIKKNTYVQQIRSLQLTQNLNINPTEEELFLHNNIKSTDFELKNFLKKQENWLKKLLKQNDLTGYYKEPYFSKEISWRWLKICNSNATNVFIAWKLYWRSTLKNRIEKKYIWIIKFFIKTIFR